MHRLYPRIIRAQRTTVRSDWSQLGWGYCPGYPHAQSELRAVHQSRLPKIENVYDARCSSHRTVGFSKTTLLHHHQRVVQQPGCGFDVRSKSIRLSGASVAGVSFRGKRLTQHRTEEAVAWFSKLLKTHQGPIPSQRWSGKIEIFSIFCPGRGSIRPWVSLKGNNKNGFLLFRCFC